MLDLPKGVDDDTLRYVFDRLLDGLRGSPEATRHQVATMIGFIGYSVTTKGGGEPQRLEMIYQMAKACFGQDDEIVKTFKVYKEKTFADRN